MILKTLKLKNFRKFKDSTIDFPDGVTGVVGLNGAGKSTIFEAIAGCFMVQSQHEHHLIK